MPRCMTVLGVITWRLLGGPVCASLPNSSESIPARCSGSAALSTAQASPWHNRYCELKRRRSDVRFRGQSGHGSTIGRIDSDAIDPKRTFRLFGRHPPRRIYVGGNLAPNDVDVTAQIIQLVREG